MAARTLIHLARFLIAAAVLLGGGGSPEPVAEAAVELGALLMLGIAIMCGLRPLYTLQCDRPAALLFVAVIAWPVLQLVPLPPELWHHLPGRGAEIAALGSVGGMEAWQPLSMVPEDGVAGLLALVPAAVLLLLTANLSLPDRVRLIGWTAMLAILAAILGVTQFIRGPARLLSIYSDVHVGWGIGFFANRNAQADLIAIALTAGVLLWGRYRMHVGSAAAFGWAAAGAVLLLGGLATGSRMGLFVLLLPVGLALAMTGRRAPFAAAGLAALALAVVFGGTALDRVVARASDAGNRSEIWGDSVFVARSVAPFGGGTGSFQPLYAAAERLDHVQPTIANRAHNDFLELAIEGGVPALALLTALLAFVGMRVKAGWCDADLDRRLLARFAGLTAATLLIHSIVDYPLRNLTLLTLAALALAGLVSQRRPAQDTLRVGEHAVADS